MLPTPPLNWIEVCGGSWKPNAVILAKAKSSLRKAVVPQLKVSNAVWRRYLIQYQGSVATNGQRIITISAFRDLPEEWRGNFDLTRDWVQVLGGASCYFSANYDPASGTILDLRVDTAK